MAPKKKGNKKQQDDWEAELGETVDPIAQAAEAAKAAEAAQDAEEDGAASGGGGGLMAALRKRKDKKGKKGKPVEDFVEGEDPPAADAPENVDAPATPPVDLADKAPVEATMDDEDVFGQPMKKGKGGKQQAKKDVDEEEDEDADGDDAEDTSGRVKTKKEKEKEKKEREKARKKEQVRICLVLSITLNSRANRVSSHHRPQQRKRLLQPKLPNQSPLRSLHRSLLSLSPSLPRLVARRRSSTPSWPPFKNSRKNVVNVKRKKLAWKLKSVLVLRRKPAWLLKKRSDKQKPKL